MTTPEGFRGRSAGSGTASTNTKTMAEKNKIRNKVCPRGVNKNDKKGVIMIRKGLISATAEIKSSNQDYSS